MNLVVKDMRHITNMEGFVHYNVTFELNLVSLNMNKND